MANRLANETSPYLRQHAENPVDWYPWSRDAFEEARSRDVPILLSVGYSSCHWCHVMAHESFEDTATATLMNSNFVNIKVDREERPDVDSIYMDATQAMTGRGGWPMTVFMTPDGEPFFCGTYFPADSSRGGTSFTQVLGAVHDLWQHRRSELLDQASQLLAAMGREIRGPEREGPDGQGTGGQGTGGYRFDGARVLDEATMSMLASLDPTYGGFGPAPKFPATTSLEHLIRHHYRSGSAASLAAVTTSLDAMAAGGIYDHLGGGFSRYSVDQYWLVPHFEKMLYDNALLANVYLRAWQVSGEERFLQTCTETIEYVLADLSHPEGGRYSAEDADSLVESEPAGYGPTSHGEEGAFYVWTPEQVADALEIHGLSSALEETLVWYGITERGNFEGASIPNRIHQRGLLARPQSIESTRAALFRERSKRPRPGLDDKVLTEWNAYMIETLANAGSATGNDKWTTEAERTAEFLCANLCRHDDSDTGAVGGAAGGAVGGAVGGTARGRWLRSWQGDDTATGSARHLAYGSDYAALVNAFVALYEATGRPRWLDEATSTADGLLELFWDKSGSVWTTGSDAEQLVVRPKDVTDNATPSATTMAAVGLLRLEAHTSERRYADAAHAIIAGLGPLALQHPRAFANLLGAIEMETLGMTEIVITGESPELVSTAHRSFRPNSVLAWGEPTGWPLWEGRTGDGSRAFVCRGGVCDAPIESAAQLQAALRDRN